MKPIHLLFAALAPFVATAGAEPAASVNQEELRGDMKITALLGADVQSEGNQDVGTVEDVILDKEGKVVSVIVQREGNADGAMEELEQGAKDVVASAESSWDEATSDRDRATRERDASSAEDGAGVDYAASEEDASADMGVDMDPDRADTVEMGDDFVKVEWNRISVDSESETVRMSGDSAGMQSISYDQSEPLAKEGEIRASDLVGMEVNLSDEESFGEVEDVLIDTKDGKASAIVVDSMEFFDKERFALPVDLANLNEEEEELTLQYTSEQVGQMEEFDMDEDSESETEQPADDGSRL